MSITSSGLYFITNSTTKDIYITDGDSYISLPSYTYRAMVYAPSTTDLRISTSEDPDDGVAFPSANTFIVTGDSNAALQCAGGEVAAPTEETATVVLTGATTISLGERCTTNYVGAYSFDSDQDYYGFSPATEVGEDLGTPPDDGWPLWLWLLIIGLGLLLLIGIIAAIVMSARSKSKETPVATTAVAAPVTPVDPPL